jgi:hypothetical protein
MVTVMQDKTALVASVEMEDEYERFEATVRVSVASLTAPLFETDTDPEALWAAYLDNFARDRRQHYACSYCRQFIQKFGGLVVVSDNGTLISALWAAEYPTFFTASVRAMERLVTSSKITGVFLTSEAVWGKPQTKTWTHLSGTHSNPRKKGLKTDFQEMAEKKEDFGILSHGLSDYPKSAVEQAVRVLKSDTIYRSEKALGVAEWFLKLHERIEGTKGPVQSNLIWQAVAMAPPGFCHVRSTMIATLLDDIQAGLSFDSISRKWAEKMHPLQYQRPTAAPTEGAIEAAEKLVAQLGLEASFNRRFATLEDLLTKVWTPSVKEQSVVKTGGFFAHLRGDKAKTAEVELPKVKITWEKFLRTVVPDATGMEVRVPTGNASFYGLLTASDADAPPILQWDGLEGHPRNPVSWFFYSGGSLANRWGLTAGSFAKVTAVFLAPHHWQEPQKFAHQGDIAFFALEGCKDTASPGLCLFPEILKVELHGIRKVVEAHSKKGGLQGAETGTANGLAFQKNGSEAVVLRVKSQTGTSMFELDRWD